MTNTALTVQDKGQLAVGAQAEEAERQASFMAREYQQATQEIARALQTVQDQCDRLKRAFPQDSSYNGFLPDISYDGDRHIGLSNPAALFEKMKRRAWRMLVEAIGIRNVMSLKKRAEFDEQMERGKLPEITEETIIGIIAGLAHDAKDFAKEAALEVFDMLRPRGGYGGQYKTNDAFRVGRRVILPYRVERAYGGGFRPNYHREKDVFAIDAVFHLLDGQGVLKERRGPLIDAILAATDGKGETAYFRFKCFKNCNLHLEFKRLDLVKDLNGLAAGEYVLGEDVD